MTEPGSKKEVIDNLIHWADGQFLVRAMLLTSSRAIPNAQVDVLSDYDVILVLRDVRPFFEDRDWLQVFGPVLAVYRDPLEPYLGFLQSGYIAQYENGLKIDFTLWPVEVMKRITDDPQLPDEFDAGYRILLDKDHLTEALKPPSFAAFIPKPPTLAVYHETIELFFLDAAYVVKFLWRGDVLAAKYVLDHFIKQDYLRPMLEWRIEIDHDWSVKPGPHMRGLKKWLRPDLWRELESTYTGADPEENWDALHRTVLLFRQVASEVGAVLGYGYPYDLDRRAVAYLEKVRCLDASAERFI